MRGVRRGCGIAGAEPLLQLCLYFVLGMLGEIQGFVSGVRKGLGAVEGTHGESATCKAQSDWKAATLSQMQDVRGTLYGS